MFERQEKDVTHSDDMRQLNIVQHLFCFFFHEECCTMLQLQFFTTNKKNLDLQLRGLTC